MIKMPITPSKYRENIKNGVFHIKSKADKYRKSRASESNRKKILEFDNEITANGLSDQTRNNYLIYLHQLAEHLKETKFNKATKDDIIRYIKKLGERGLMESSINSIKTRIKTFYIWLNNNEKPDCVNWIKLKKKRRKINPEDILTEDEIKKMIEVTDSPRDRAIISTLYETGCRIGEFMDIKLKDMKFGKYGLTIKVDGKTGERELTVMNCIPYLKEWLKYHPLKNKPNSYLWVNFSKNQPKNIGNQLKYNGIYQIIKRSSELAKIDKKINPHAFRHARATILAGKLKESYLREYMGWVKGSNIVEIYVHISNENLKNVTLSEVYGVHLDNLEDLRDKLVPKICYNCGEKNILEKDYCTKCNYPLDIKEAKNREKQLLSLLTPEILERMINKKLEQLIMKKMGE